METIEVTTKDRTYAIVVGHGIMNSLGERCRTLPLGEQVAVISDVAVGATYLHGVVGGLEKAGYKVVPILFPGGDGTKNLVEAEKIFAAMIAAEMDRSAWVVALGGGVVGDMAGFVAATFLRGIPFVQVPTTIVAQVDASIGGKTAVNHSLGKNLIGSFHQPHMVLTDTAALGSLPLPEMVAGMAEVVKHAIIRDAELFSFLEENLEASVSLQLTPDSVDWLIFRNVGIKVAVVREDEREVGIRAILNYGHTLGHAIEAATSYQKYRHGEGVILGMIAAGHIAVRQGFWSEAERGRQDALLARLGVPGGIGQVSAEAIVERTRADKKRVAGKTRLILGKAIGRVEIVDHLGEDELREGVDYLQDQYG